MSNLNQIRETAERLVDPLNQEDAKRQAAEVLINIINKHLPGTANRVGFVKVEGKVEVVIKNLKTSSDKNIGIEHKEQRDSISQTDSLKNIKLIFAARAGRTDELQSLLDSGADVHAREDEALRDAAQLGRVDVVRMLLDRGANVHAWEEQALRDAAAQGHLEVVKLLVGAGADVNVREGQPHWNAKLNFYAKDTEKFLREKTIPSFR